MSFEQYVIDDMRLRLLQSLRAAPDYTLNEVVLRNALTQQGHAVGRDRLRAEMAWLDEMGLATLQMVGNDQTGVRLLTLSSRGEDCAQGLANVPGVARPRAGG